MDWRVLFLKYVKVVVSNEGTDFLYENEWSKDEWETISALLAEIDIA